MLTQAASFFSTIPLCVVKREQKAQTYLDYCKPWLYFDMCHTAACHLANSLATVSLGHVTKAAECVPEL